MIFPEVDPETKLMACLLTSCAAMFISVVAVMQEQTLQDKIRALEQRPMCRCEPAAPTKNEKKVEKQPDPEPQKKVETEPQQQVRPPQQQEPQQQQLRRGKRFKTTDE